MSERVLVIGTGLIGGSVALALKSAGHHVAGFDALPENAHAAHTAGAIDEVREALHASDVDVVVVATPVGEILATIAEVALVAKSGGRSGDYRASTG